MAKNGKSESPIDRQIFLKNRLIKTLEKSISNVKSEADQQVKKIQFRIDMAKTLVNALQKGR